MLDPVLLRSFLTVTDTGSFTQAAATLHLTQSAVSAHLRRLEADVGHRLFDRTTRTVVPTAAGRQLAGYARSILALTAEARLSLDARRHLRGRIRVGASEGMAKGPLIECLRHFGTSHDGVEVALQIGLMGDLLDLVDQGGLDVVLGSRCGSDPRGEALWTEPLVWAAAAHVDATQPILSLAVYPDACPYRAAAIEALARADRRWRIACQSPSGEGLLMAVAAGLGIMPMTRSACRAADLREVDGLPALPPAQFVLVNRGATPAATAIADDIRRCMTNHVVSNR